MGNTVTVIINGCEDEWTFDEVGNVYWTKSGEYGVVYKGEVIRDDIEGTISEDDYRKLVTVRPELQIYTAEEFFALFDILD